MSTLLEDDKLPYGMANAKNIDLNQVVLFTMLQNHENKTIEWMLTFPTETEKNHYSYYLNRFAVFQQWVVGA